jgi:hypothetical protein
MGGIAGRIRMLHRGDLGVHVTERSGDRRGGNGFLRNGNIAVARPRISFSRAVSAGPTQYDHVACLQRTGNFAGLDALVFSLLRDFGQLG